MAESAGLAAPFEAMLWNVVAVPRNTPAEVRKRLADATQLAMADTAMLGKLAEQGMFADLHVGDANATAFVKSEAAKWEPVITKLGDLVKR